MSDLQVLLVVAACLCSLGECATLSDLHSVLNREADRLRLAGIKEVQLKALEYLEEVGLSPEESACLCMTRNLVAKELNEAIVPTQHDVRAEIPTYWAPRLPTLTVEELNAEVTTILEDAVHDVTKSLLKRLKKCV